MFGWQELFEPTPEAVAERVREFVTTGAVTSLEGDPVTVTAASICVHSDTPGAARIGPAVRAAIEGAGHAVSSELPTREKTTIEGDGVGARRGDSRNARRLTFRPAPGPTASCSPSSKRRCLNGLGAVAFAIVVCYAGRPVSRAR